MKHADDEAAATVHRVAALVAGGLSLERAWAVLGTDAAALGAQTGGGGAGGRTGGGLAVAVLAVAQETGAPMAPTLERLAGLLREQAAQRRALEAALAGPRATAKLVMVLPIVGLGFGLALGLDVLGAAAGGGIGTWSVLAGAALLVAAWVWSRAIVRRAARGDPAPGLALDLVAVALAGGGAADRAREVAATALEDAGVRASGWDAVDEALHLARRAGVPVRGLLLAEASAARTRARLDGEARAQRAAVQLALPLGACVLPAFSLLVIVPLVVSMLEGALTPLA
ncbi:type II secretion system F family protein [Agrococcus sp. ARC_14]|uniref:type II secretion system F family protein n=1 Tax=Agrococcus sp. ARC_14 TaxID=2919927 RepID=UPI001F06409D|nr:type II secretion system F family protein [Agrococcus sp. ARC_14]MCH1882232.1 type II secretion system F family protein [Agrococcus sp. ARC_14]